MTVEPAASPTAGAQDDAAIPAAPPQKGPTRYRIYVDAATDDRRLAAVQDAERDGVYLDFVLAPVNYLGVVPVATEVKRNRKVGR